MRGQAVFVRKDWSRPLLRLALVLAVVVVGASSYLRLAGNGLGCEPWPACYGTTAAFEQANQGAVVQALRLTHRVTASLFLLVAIAAVALGWARWHGAQRAQAVALLVVTAVLAGIGRLTPSPMPWITWVNVLGGFALIALTLLLSSSAQPDGDAAQNPRAKRIGAALLVLLVLQVIGGTLLSVRLAAAECQPACTHAPGGDLLQMWRPDRAGSATALAGSGGAAQLHGLHRVGGLLLALAALATVALAPASPLARAVAVAAAAVLVLGFASTHVAGAGTGAAHALAAAFLLALLALRWHTRNP